MSALSTDEIDRELDSRTKEVAAMSTTLLELENHPGLQHVRLYPPTGKTAHQWEVIEKSLAQLWEDLGRMTSILDDARMVRARRSKPEDDDRKELTKLLRGRPLEVSRRPIPLSQRKIGGVREAVEYVGLAETAERMHAAYPAVVEFLDDVDRINSVIADQLAPIQERLEAAGTAGPEQIGQLLQISATDPLSLTTRDVAQRIAVIAKSVEERSAELAELAAIQSDWSEALATTAQSLDELREVSVRATETRLHAVQVVLAGPFPKRDDAEPALRAELQSITTLDPPALRSLRHRIATALRAARDEEELAQGLLDRRSELKGRLTAYQAKAARLGLGEDRDLLACNRIADGLLSRKPCDLRAVTRAISDYQQMLVEKREKTQ